jgi:hypothetical protein
MITRYLSDLMIKPGKAPLFDDPADFGLDHEDVTFQTADGVTLSGWLIKGGTDKVIIQSHFGVQCSRSGYTPRGKGAIKLWKDEIHLLGHAKHLVERGYSLLMYDLRNHGESGKGPNDWITYGKDESLDLIAAVEFVSNRPEYREAEIGLLSICMGACATTYAYGSSDALKSNDRIKAMIAVQPLTYSAFIRAMGLPGFLAKRVTAKNNERAGFDYETTSFMPFVKEIAIPTLVVQNRNDPMLNEEMMGQFFDDIRTEKEMRWLDLAKSRGAAYAYLPEHPKMISEFFDRYMSAGER